VKHSKLADGVEQALQNKKIVSGVDPANLKQKKVNGLKFEAHPFKYSF
jgi:hypothetical protein